MGPAIEASFFDIAAQLVDKRKRSVVVIIFGFFVCSFFCSYVIIVMVMALFDAIILMWYSLDLHE